MYTIGRPLSFMGGFACYFKEGFVLKGWDACGDFKIPVGMSL